MKLKNPNDLIRTCVFYRYSSHNYSPPIPPALVGTAVGKDESREFMAVFPDIVRDLTEAGRHLDIPDVTKWYAKVVSRVDVNNVERIELSGECRMLEIL